MYAKEHTLYALMANHHRKRGYEKALRTTVSLTPRLAKAFQQVKEDGGYTGLSDYLQQNIRLDAKMVVRLKR